MICHFKRYILIIVTEDGFLKAKEVDVYGAFSAKITQEPWTLSKKCSQN